MNAMPKMNPIEHITVDDVTEDKVHQFSAEASSLCWPAGHWPLTLKTDLGNGLDLYKVFQTAEYARYRQTSGCVELTVFND